MIAPSSISAERIRELRAQLGEAARQEPLADLWMLTMADAYALLDLASRALSPAGSDLVAVIAAANEPFIRVHHPGGTYTDYVPDDAEERSIRFTWGQIRAATELRRLMDLGGEKG